MARHLHYLVWNIKIQSNPQNIPKFYPVGLDAGMYFELRVDFDYVSLKFTTTFNGEVLEPPYPIPTQKFHFLQNVTTDGDHNLYHFGFTYPGESSCCAILP